MQTLTVTSPVRYKLVQGFHERSIMALSEVVDGVFWPDMRTFFLVLVVISQFFYPNFSQAREEKITVGAIRWDGWGKWGETYHEERYLGPPEWRDRIGS